MLFVLNVHAVCPKYTCCMYMWFVLNVSFYVLNVHAVDHKCTHIVCPEYIYIYICYCSECTCCLNYIYMPLVLDVNIVSPE